MHSKVREALEEYPRHPTNPYIFYRGDKDRQKGVRKEFDKLLAVCKIEGFRFHDLRHTFASQLVMQGRDLYTVMQLLGHKSLQMVQRYAHLSQDYLRKAVEPSITKVSQSVFEERLAKL